MLLPCSVHALRCCCCRCRCITMGGRCVYAMHVPDQCPRAQQRWVNEQLNPCSPMHVSTIPDFRSGSTDS
eukprot:2782218-Alexandrium_andersonii.AAC.1